jgi:hypothetical protein
MQNSNINIDLHSIIYDLQIINFPSSLKLVFSCAGNKYVILLNKLFIQNKANFSTDCDLPISLEKTIIILQFFFSFSMFISIIVLIKTQNTA